MLKAIHASHLGIVKCKSRARESLFWPGISSQIEEEIEKCSTCALNQKQNPKQPMLETDTPNRPWSIVSTDLLEFRGHHYLITVDHYSKWPELAKLDNLSSNNTISYLKSQFARYGVPDKLLSDNGPQYSSSLFAKFARDYGFIHVTTSPHYSQSNGQAERTVQTVKNMLRKAEDPYKALLAYRNTVLEDIGLSPAQLFLGRMLKTDIPTTEPLLSANDKLSREITTKLKMRKWKQKEHYDKHAAKTPLRDLQRHEKVVMRNNNKWVPATVENYHETPRSYIVQHDGRRYRRNRIHIRPTQADIREPESNTFIHIDPPNRNVMPNPVIPPITNSEDNNTHVLRQANQVILTEVNKGNLKFHNLKKSQNQAEQSTHQ